MGVFRLRGPDREPFWAERGFNHYGGVNRLCVQQGKDTDTSGKPQRDS